MQQQQDRVLLKITLAGLGLIAGIFGLVAWLVDGGTFSEPALRSENDSPDSSLSSVATVSEDQIDGIQDVPKGLFNYGGSTTWIPVHKPVNEAITRAFPDFQLRYTLPPNGAPGSGTGVEMLLDGQLSFSESSRPLKPSEYDTAQQRGFTLEQVPAALDGSALAVHPDLDIPGLSVDQLQAIYTGVVTNWSELGGPDLPITAYSRPPEAAGTAEYFLDSIIDAETYGANVIFVKDTTTGIRQVLAERGGIYYASAPEIVNQCSIYALPIASQEQPDTFVPPFAEPWKAGQACINQPNVINKVAFREGAYPLTRRLFVIVKADGSRDETAGRAYVNMLLSDEGQALLEEAEFISIR